MNQIINRIKTYLKSNIIETKNTKSLHIQLNDLCLAFTKDLKKSRQNINYRHKYRVLINLHTAFLSALIELFIEATVIEKNFILSIDHLEWFYFHENEWRINEEEFLNTSEIFNSTEAHHEMFINAIHDKLFVKLKKQKDEDNN
jgi:hypothetical protein